MIDKPPIPDSWTVPVVAMTLTCSYDEARSWLDDHADDADIVLSLEREATRRSTARWQQMVDKLSDVGLIR